MTWDMTTDSTSQYSEARFEWFFIISIWLIRQKILSTGADVKKDYAGGF